MDDIQRSPRLGTTGDGESEFGPFVASKTRPHFHRPGCKWAAYLSVKNMLEFSSHAEAVAAGKKPCKTCKAWTSAAHSPLWILS
jgi:methylphosphotriester-DNA--protein-cysteine methyltransferase